MSCFFFIITILNAYFTGKCDFIVIGHIFHKFAGNVNLIYQQGGLERVLLLLKIIPR